MAVDQVVKRLATDTGKGLDAAEAASRLEKHGPNHLPEGNNAVRMVGPVESIAYTGVIAS